jgi:uncharacterized protein (DUF1501 family)
MLNRRFFLQGSALLACSAAAHPFMNSVTLAATPGEARLVVIILRGAMDGLDVVQPYGDKNLAGLRQTISRGPAAGALDLDGFFAAHASLAPLMPLWSAGELGFAHAVSTPYRDKRSHFDGQDLLEAGTGMDVPAEFRRDGWLNRLLQQLPDARAETAFSVGEKELLVLAGSAPALSWSPKASLKVSSQGQRLLESVYHDDPLFREAMAAAGEISGGEMGAPMEVEKGATGAAKALAQFAADRMNEETRIAAFSLNGWDTHRSQSGLLKGPLERLAEMILTLKSGLGANWGQTTVLAMTEFGRTARENGTGGTDHGTGGAMLLAGGAIRGGRVYGTWPGLGEGDLYAGRDLKPTADVRNYAAWAMRGMFGLESGTLERAVFPGLDLGRDPGMLL